MIGLYACCYYSSLLFFLWSLNYLSFVVTVFVTVVHWVPFFACVMYEWTICFYEHCFYFRYRDSCYFILYVIIIIVYFGNVIKYKFVLTVFPNVRPHTCTCSLLSSPVPFLVPISYLIHSFTNPSFYKVHSLYNWMPPYVVYLLPPLIIRMSRISDSRYHGLGHSTNENHRRAPRGYINPRSSVKWKIATRYQGTLSFLPCRSNLFHPRPG